MHVFNLNSISIAIWIKNGFQSEKEIQLSLFKLYHLENAIDNLMGDVRLTYDEQKTLNQVKKSVEISMKDKKKVRGEMTRMLGTKEKALNTAVSKYANIT